MLALLRERLTLALLALLPLHALGVTVLTKVFSGPNHAPLSAIAIWKEALLLIILVIAVGEIVKKVVSGQWSLVSKFDALDVCIVIALIYSLLIHPWDSDTAVSSYIYGFRYDFVPLVAFLILRRVSWSMGFLNAAIKILIIVGSLVAAYGLLTLVLPDRWFAFLGYSALHSLYIPDGPIAAFQFISETGIRRIQSTFSGPNQLGLWLLIPLSLVIGRKRIGEVISDKWSLLRQGYGGQVVISFIFILTALVFTFSRAAWVAAVVVLIFLWTRRKNPALMVKKIEKGERVSTRVSVILIGVVVTVSALAYLFPEAILRPFSTSAHLTRPLHALQMIAERPLGLGLGSAGPASNRTSDACVELPAGGDATWAAPFPNLCVFVGGTQVQPTDRTCSCPVVTENWYLQWGVEMGLLGLLVSLLLPFFVLRKLIMNNEQLIMTNARKSIAATFLALSIAALFLHAFEDSAVAYTFWVLLSATLPPWKVQTAPSSSSTSADSTRT